MKKTTKAGKGAKVKHPPMQEQLETLARMVQRRPTRDEFDAAVAKVRVCLGADLVSLNMNLNTEVRRIDGELANRQTCSNANIAAKRLLDNLHGRVSSLSDTLARETEGLSDRVQLLEQNRYGAITDLEAQVRALNVHYRDLYRIIAIERRPAPWWRRLFRRAAKP